MAARPLSRVSRPRLRRHRYTFIRNGNLPNRIKRAMLSHEARPESFRETGWPLGEVVRLADWLRHVNPLLIKMMIRQTAHTGQHPRPSAVTMLHRHRLFHRLSGSVRVVSRDFYDGSSIRLQMCFAGDDIDAF